MTDRDAKRVSDTTKRFGYNAGYIRVVKSPQNGVHVEVSDGYTTTAVHFYDPVHGGGPSAKTHAALLNLMQAIKEDNQKEQNAR